MTDSSPPQFSAENPGLGRRHWLTGAVAGAAILGGIGLAWRVYQTPNEGQAVDSRFWDLEFAAPGGGSLATRSLRGKPLLLNFWATWCPPCVQELPLLSSFYQENSVNGWQVLGLAVDQLDAVKRFLAQAPVTFPVALAGAGGIEMSRAFGNRNGGLPFTVILGADGGVLHRKLGQLTPEDLRTWTGLK